MDNKNILLHINNAEITNKKRNNESILTVNNMQVQRGDAVFILGDNGSGKSSFLKALFSYFSTDDYASLSTNSDIILHSCHNFDLQLNKGDLQGDNAKKSMLQSLEIQDNREQSFVYISQEEDFVRFDSIMKVLKTPATRVLTRLRNRMKDEYFDKLELIDKLAEKYALQFLKDEYAFIKKYLEASEDQKRDVALGLLKKIKANDCSGGQKKMISLLCGIIRAQVIDVDLLVLDEPLNHLDKKNKEGICKILSDIRTERQQQGNPITYMIVSHCLVFDFINEDSCKQYKIVNKQLKTVKTKLYHSCLKDDVICED